MLLVKRIYMNRSILIMSRAFYFTFLLVVFLIIDAVVYV
jgi:hypothetical protein